MNQKENNVRKAADNQSDMDLRGAGSMAWLASSTIGPRINFNLEGGGNDPAPVVAAVEPVAAPAPDLKVDAKVAATEPKVTPPAAGTRPEGISDEFWDDKTNSVKFADLTGRLNELAAFKAEQDSRLLTVPEKPEGYEIKLPADFKTPEGFALPEGQQVGINADDPRIQEARAYVHAMNGTQADFENLVAMGVRADIQERVSFEKAQKAEVEKLGTRGVERVTAMKTWLDARGLQSISRVIFAAEQVEAVEKLMSAFRNDVSGKPGAGRDGKLSGRIEGYDQMNTRQKLAAALNARK